jgi:hypothetical protein
MTLTADQGKKPWYEVTGEQSGTEKIRQRLREMSDAELLRFGMVAKYMCSQEANPEDASREDFVLQLTEAQREWNKRFSRLPLVTTFSRDER